MKHPLLSLFLRSLAVSATTVGGGYVILAVLRSRYVVRRGLISAKEMDDLSAIAQSAPGAVAVNASLLVGYRLAGAAGAALSALGTLLPPLFIMTVLAAAGGMLRDNPVFQRFLPGMRAGAAAVVFDTALRVTAGSLREKSVLRGILFAASLGLVLFTRIGTPALLGLSALAGALSSLLAKDGRKRSKKRAQDPSENTSDGIRDGKESAEV